jgi:hypothetical protein
MAVEQTSQSGAESVRTGGSPGGEDQPIGILNSCPAHELSALPIAADFSTE